MSVPTAILTDLKVHGRWCYLYRAIDRSGALVDVLFSGHCNRQYRNFRVWVGRLILFRPWLV